MDRPAANGDGGVGVGAGAGADSRAWYDDAALVAAQRRLAVAAPPPWRPGTDPLTVAAAFVAFARGEAGPGRAGDRGWAGAVLLDEHGAVLATAAVTGHAPGPYTPGLLARREGPLLLAALRALPRRADVLLVDATGRDHPRRAGLALHLGALLDVPSVGVTHRPLLAAGTAPESAEAGSTAPLVIDGEIVAAWVLTRRDVRPVVAHAAWRTDVDAAVEVVLRTTRGARTPEPLRAARTVARTARVRDEASSEGPAG